MKRFLLILLVPACALVGVACGDDTSVDISAATSAPSTSSTTTSTTTSASTAGPATTTTPPAGGASTRPIGLTRETPVATITIHALQYPTDGAEAAGARLPEGLTSAAVDAEVCPRDGAQVAPTGFLLVTTDGREWQWANQPAGAREPDLAPELDGKLASGTCARGWLTFEIEPDQTVTSVLFHPPRSNERFTFAVD